MRFWWKSPRRVNRQVGPCSRRYLLPAQARPHWVPVGREQKQRVARQIGVAPLEHKPIWISREIDECPSQSSETERAQLYPETLRRQSPPNTRHPTRAARDQQGPRRAISQYLIARQQFEELQRDQAPAPALASRTPCTSQHTAIWPVFHTAHLGQQFDPAHLGAVISLDGIFATSSSTQTHGAGRTPEPTPPEDAEVGKGNRGPRATFTQIFALAERPPQRQNGKREARHHQQAKWKRPTDKGASNRAQQHTRKTKKTRARPNGKRDGEKDSLIGARTQIPRIGHRKKKSVLLESDYTHARIKSKLFQKQGPTGGSGRGGRTVGAKKGY